MSSGLPVREGRVRVDAVVHVTSPDLVRSPVSGVSAALVEVAAFESHEGAPRWLRSRRYGDRLEVTDAAGSRLLVVVSEAVSVVATGLFPSPVPSPLPPELAELIAADTDAAREVHLHETRFRMGDALRILGTVDVRTSVTTGPYRAIGSALVPVPGGDEPLFLFELLAEG